MFCFNCSLLITSEHLARYIYILNCSAFNCAIFKLHEVPARTRMKRGKIFLMHKNVDNVFFFFNFVCLFLDTSTGTGNSQTTIGVLRNTINWLMILYSTWAWGQFQHRKRPRDNENKYTTGFSLVGSDNGGHATGSYRTIIIIVEILFFIGNATDAFSVLLLLFLSIEWVVFTDPRPGGHSIRTIYLYTQYVFLKQQQNCSRFSRR